jgi:hypothetical protein
MRTPRANNVGHEALGICKDFDGKISALVSVFFLTLVLTVAKHQECDCSQKTFRILKSLMAETSLHHKKLCHETVGAQKIQASTRPQREA